MTQEKTASFSVRQEEQADYLNIIVEGNGSLDNSMLIHNEILQLLKNTDSEYALIDITRLDGRLSIADSIKRAESIPMEVRTKLKRTAMLERIENKVFARNEEMAMTNRGIKIKIFFDLDQAIGWLREHKQK